MKKLISLVLAVFTLAGGAGLAFAETADMDLAGEALVEAAKAEIGDNTLVVYSPSSRHSKSAADFINTASRWK